MSNQNIPWKRLSVEATAIVASILLAFAIDAWWEDRQERELEQQYVASLKADFQADIEELDEAIALAKYRALLNRQLISTIDKGRVEGDPNEFIWAVFSSFLLNYPSYTRATINVTVNRHRANDPGY